MPAQRFRAGWLREAIQRRETRANGQSQDWDSLLFPQENYLFTQPIALCLAASFSNGENRLGKASDGDGCLDRGMRIVADEREILELEIVNIFDRTIELHLR